MRKTKKFAAILLSALILSSSFSALPVSAATVGNDTAVVSSDESLISGDYEYSVLADSTVEITRYFGSDSDVTIPNTIDDKKVTSIGSETFHGCISLTSVIMPDSITSIGDLAFSECISLVNIAIHDSVMSIGFRAFGDCKNLSSITVPNSVKNIGNGGDVVNGAVGGAAVVVVAVGVFERDGRALIKLKMFLYLVQTEKLIILKYQIVLQALKIGLFQVVQIWKK